MQVDKNKDKIREGLAVSKQSTLQKKLLIKREM